ncbi:MAG: DLW-39 family protein [Dermabacter sp.]|nr:DLW-39 family protein [Dermabacter sp.]
MKFVRALLMLIASTAVGLFAWRKVEEKQLRDDLWQEAEERTR